MLERALFWIWGWVELELTGEEPERFFNLLLAQGLVIRESERYADGRVRFRIGVGRFSVLRRAARGSACRLHILRKGGVPFILARLERRPVLPAGACLLVLLLCLLPALVLSVAVESPVPLETLSEEEILRLAAENGVAAGAWKRKLDFDETERRMMQAEPLLAWVEIRAEGTRVTLSVVEREIAAEARQKQAPGDLVASADAVVEDILLISGVALVQEGDVVAAGDVLVSGAGSHAAAVVTARVWRQAEGEWPLLEQGWQATGREARSVLVSFADKRIRLWGGGERDFAHSSSYVRSQPLVLWRNISFPVELNTEYYSEQEAYSREWGEAAAKEKATALARAELARCLPEEYRLLSEQEREANTREGFCRVTLQLETEEDIARFVPAAGD